MNKKIFTTVAFLLAIISMILGELVFHMLPETVWVRIACKIVSGVSILAYAFCCRNRKEWGFSWIFAALAFSVAGDVTISLSFLPGVILFALGHLCLVILFCRQRALPKNLWILWGAVSLVFVAGILYLGRNMGLYAYEAAGYAPVILLMAFTAIRQHRLIRIAGCFYVASDMLLALYQWKRIHPAVHVVYMGLFYAALLLLAGIRFERSIEKEN